MLAFKILKSCSGKPTFIKEKVSVSKEQNKNRMMGKRVTEGCVMKEERQKIRAADGGPDNNTGIT